MADIEKGHSPLEKTPPGQFPLVGTASEWRTAGHAQISRPAVCIPLVSSTGHGHASIKRLHFVDQPFALSNMLAAVIPYRGGPIDAAFLFHYLTCFKERLLVSRMKGTANVSLKVADLSDIPVLAPPRHEQRRIVDLMNAVDAYVAAADARVEAAQTARTALLADLLSDSSPGWVKTTLQNVCEMQLGKMLSKERAAGPDQAPYLRNANVQAGMLVMDDLKSMTFTDADRDRYALKAGDILVCEGGDPGRAVLLNRALEGVFFQKTLHRLRATHVMSSFLYLAVNLAYDDGRIGDLCTNTTIKHLTAEKFRRLLINVPPEWRQAEIVEIMSAADQSLVVAKDTAIIARTFRSALLSDLLSGNHEIPASYDRFLRAA